MSTNRVTIELNESATNGIRAAFGVGGLLALIIGILILVWPDKTAIVVTAIVAIWALIAALVNLAVGIFSRQIGNGPRIGHLVGGVLMLAFSVWAFANLGAAATGLATLLGIIVGIAWVVQGIVALTMLGGARSKGWGLAYAALSILAGVILLFSPLLAATVLFALIGVSFIVLGIAQLVRAYRFGAA